MTEKEMAAKRNTRNIEAKAQRKQTKILSLSFRRRTLKEKKTKKKELKFIYKNKQRNAD